MDVRKGRQILLAVSTLIGVFALLGAGWFTVAGAGMFGSPFAGDTYFNATLMLVLICGPLTILPCTLLEMLKPRWGGMLLCSLSLAEAGVLVLNNCYQWGFAIHNAALGSLCLAAPMFLLGFLFLGSTPSKDRWSPMIWWGETTVAAVVAAFFLVMVGRDGAQALFYWLQGGTI